MKLAKKIVQKINIKECFIRASVNQRNDKSLKFYVASFDSLKENIFQIFDKLKN